MPSSSAAANEVWVELMRLCLTPDPARRPSVHSLLQWLTARAVAATAGENPLPIEQRRVHRGAGRLSLSELCASGLWPKGKGGVKAYLLVTCGGTRRVTPIAPRGRSARWTAPLVLATHGLAEIELSVWAAHRRTTHDFLGCVTLALPALLPEPAAALSLPVGAMPLRRRSSRSRVSGELSLTLAWQPYVPPAATTSAGGGGAVAAATHAPASAPPPSQPPAASTGTAADGGSFWASAFADDPPLPSFAAPAAAPAAAAASTTVLPPQQPVQPPSPPATSGVGSFWQSEAAASTAFSAADGPKATAPQQAGALMWAPASSLFADVDTLAAPWESSAAAMTPGVAGGGQAVAAVAAGSRTFWTTFDASPQFGEQPAEPSWHGGAQVTSAGTFWDLEPAAGAAATASDTFNAASSGSGGGSSLIDFGVAAPPSANDLWSDLATLGCGSGGGNSGAAASSSETQVPVS